MDIKAYIASGVLELYALGSLSPAEKQEVEVMLAQYPLLKDELNAIELQFEEMAMTNAVAPKMSFEQIAEAIEATKLSEVEKDIPVVDINHLQTRIKRFYRLSVAASVAALVFAGLAANYWGKYQTVEQDLVAIRADQEQFANNYNMVRGQLDQLESDIRVIGDDDFQKIELGPAEGIDNALAHVYWNTESKDVYLSISNLRELADNQQYQLWTIVDGKPVDQGVFDWNSQGLIHLKNASGNVSAFAVTIEPKGGSTEPSLATMQVIGNVPTT